MIYSSVLFFVLRTVRLRSLAGGLDFADAEWAYAGFRFLDMIEQFRFCRTCRLMQKRCHFVYALFIFRFPGGMGGIRGFADLLSQRQGAAIRSRGAFFNTAQPSLPAAVKTAKSLYYAVFTGLLLRRPVGIPGRFEVMLQSCRERSLQGQAGRITSRVGQPNWPNSMD